MQVADSYMAVSQLAMTHLSCSHAAYIVQARQVIAHVECTDRSLDAARALTGLG